MKPTKEELEDLRKTMSREEIAKHYQVPLSRVKRWISTLKVAPKRHKPIPISAMKRKAPEEDWKYEDMTARARTILKRRLREDHRGYILDGRHVSSFAVYKAAGLL